MNRCRFSVTLMLVFIVFLSSSRCASCSGITHEIFVGLLKDGNNIYAAFNYLYPGNGGAVASYTADGRLRWKKCMPDNPVTGNISLSRTMICISTLKNGTDICDPSTGKTIKHFNVDSAYFGVSSSCSDDYAVLLNGTVLSAYKYPGLRYAWKYDAGNSRIYTITAVKDGFDVCLSDNFYAELGGKPKNFRTIRLRSSDGRRLSVTKLSPPLPGSVTRLIPPYTDDMPKHVPSAIQKWLSKLLKVDAESYIRRTSIEHIGDRWYVGIKNHSFKRRMKSKVYAIRGDDARILWSREAPGLEEILLFKNQVIVMCVSGIVSEWSGNQAHFMILSLDARTGKRRWTNDLPKLDNEEARK
ncbi:MAG: hypothetical protein ACYC27_13670 [Armatimonadota bacterium]